MDFVIKIDDATTSNGRSRRKDKTKAIDKENKMMEIIQSDDDNDDNDDNMECDNDSSTESDTEVLEKILLSKANDNQQTEDELTENDENDENDKENININSRDIVKKKQNQRRRKRRSKPEKEEMDLEIDDEEERYKKGSETKNKRKANRVSIIDEEEEEQQQNKEYQPTSKVRKRRILNFSPKRISSKRFVRGKTVFIQTKSKKKGGQTRGWIVDINDKQILIRFHKDSNSKSTKFAEKWFKKTNKNIKLFNRNNQ